MSTESPSLRKEIMETLEQVLDPCSCFTDEPVNIVDLGLVEDVEISEEGDVQVNILPTSQACLFFVNMSNEIQERLDDNPAINEVVVTHEREKIWDEERMADGVRQSQKKRFEERVAESGLSPYNERTD